MRFSIVKEKMKGLIIPIVLPEYRILVDRPPIDVDLLPWVSFDNFTIPSSKQKVSNLEHAGIFIWSLGWRLLIFKK